jgi:hypothetical protein
VVTISGGCRCGAVRYTLALDDLPPTYACHCSDCQTWSGSAFSQQAVVPEDAIAATGPITVFELTSPSCRVSRQRMCGVCPTRIFNTNSARPGMAVIRAGTLDRSSELRVTAHIWTRSKQPWLELPVGAPTWPEAPPPEDMARALGFSR